MSKQGAKSQSEIWQLYAYGGTETAAGSEISIKMKAKHEASSELHAFAVNFPSV